MGEKKHNYILSLSYCAFLLNGKLNTNMDKYTYDCSLNMLAIKYFQTWGKIIRIHFRSMSS